MRETDGSDSTSGNRLATGADEQGYIGIDRAKEIALEHAGLNGQDVAFTKAKMDRDDGIDVCEIEFISGSMEHQ